MLVPFYVGIFVLSLHLEGVLLYYHRTMVYYEKLLLKSFSFNNLKRKIIRSEVSTKKKVIP
jgi:hypothetical protein